MNSDANTVGAQVARSVGVHMEPVEPVELSGSDPKSRAIIAALQDAIDTDRTLVADYNNRLDDARCSIKESVDQQFTAN